MSTPSDGGPFIGDSHRLTSHDKAIIARANQIAGISGRAGVRAHLGTAVPFADTARAYAKSLDQARRIIGELLAIIERLADSGGAGTMDSAQDEPLTMLIRPRAYEITFTGRAGDVLRAAFDDCTLVVGPGTTTLHAQLSDQAALWGLVQRIIGLGLEVVDMHLVAPD